MTRKLRITLDTDKYRQPTEEEIGDAKDYVLLMNEYGILLGEKVMDVLRDAAKRIVAICYRYGIQPKQFQFSANEDMQKEVYAVMDEAEEEILSLMEDYALKCTESDDTAALLLAWMLLLGRAGKTLADTLADRLRQFLYDLEAQISAMMLAEYTLGKALKRIIETLTDVWSAAEVRKAVMRPLDSMAYYIRKGGVHTGNVGLSSSGANNVVNLARTTLAMVWQRARMYIYRETGAVGYYQLRGSNYPCGPCDAEVGFHEGLEGIGEHPLVHPNCMCYRVPIYKR